ncbi:MAG: winged helix-turn-helix domain-containing protein [Bacteroidota bacterium]
MRLSGFKRFFFTIVSLLITVFQVASQEAYEDKQVKVAMRMIGHHALANAGDTTSLVLPIIKLDNSYKIQFESDFEIIPDELVATVEKVLKKTEILRAYILEVQKCETGEIVYSYEIKAPIETNVGHCAARILPECCYNLLVTIGEDELPVTNLIEESLADMNAAAVQPIAVSKDDSGNNPYLFLAFLILGMVMVLFFIWKKRKQPPVDPNLVPIGKYQFDKRNTELRIEDRKIELTTKEAELLLFLYNTVNTTVEREVILNMVWGDEGDYVGRTLDVFISKLRKKLDADSSVKIINIRGVGYKLVADV